MRLPRLTCRRILGFVLILTSTDYYPLPPTSVFPSFELNSVERYDEVYHFHHLHNRFNHRRVEKSNTGTLLHGNAGGDGTGKGLHLHLETTPLDPPPSLPPNFPTYPDPHPPRFCSHPSPSSPELSSSILLRNIVHFHPNLTTVLCILL